MTGVSVTFQYGAEFDREAVASIARTARAVFEEMPGLRFKAFTFDEARRCAINFYVWDSADAAAEFFSQDMRERVTGLYGVEPAIAFLQVAELVDNAPAARPA